MEQQVLPASVSTTANEIATANLRYGTSVSPAFAAEPHGTLHRGADRLQLLIGKRDSAPIVSIATCDIADCGIATCACHPDAALGSFDQGAASVDLSAGPDHAREGRSSAQPIQTKTVED
jgi:hypothetical protein